MRSYDPCGLDAHRVVREHVVYLRTVSASFEPVKRADILRRWMQDAEGVLKANCRAVSSTLEMLYGGVVFSSIEVAHENRWILPGLPRDQLRDEFGASDA